MQDQHNVHLSENLKTCIYVNTYLFLLAEIIGD